MHSSNNYIDVLNAEDKRLYSKRHDNRIDDVLKVLGKFKASLQGVVIESTYNWYWLVDGLMDQGYTVHLANQSMITRNRGLNFSGVQIKRLRDEFEDKLFSDRHLVFTAKRNIATIQFLDCIVGEIEQEVGSQIKIKKSLSNC